MKDITFLLKLIAPFYLPWCAFRDRVQLLILKIWSLPGASTLSLFL